MAGAAFIPLQNWLEEILVFFKSLSYTSLEIGLRLIFLLLPQKILQIFKFLEKSNGGRDSSKSKKLFNSGFANSQSEKSVSYV